MDSSIILEVLLFGYLLVLFNGVLVMFFYNLKQTKKVTNFNSPLEISTKDAKTIVSNVNTNLAEELKEEQQLNIKLRQQLVFHIKHKTTEFDIEDLEETKNVFSFVKSKRFWIIVSIVFFAVLLIVLLFIYGNGGESFL